MLAYDYPLLGIFWSLLLLFIFVMVGFAVIYAFIDNFRRSDHSGLAERGTLKPLISLFVDEVSRRDQGMLDELERLIQRKKAGHP